MISELLAAIHPVILRGTVLSPEEFTSRAESERIMLPARRRRKGERQMEEKKGEEEEEAVEGHEREKKAKEKIIYLWK